jgi:hypothetical protein
VFVEALFLAVCLLFIPLVLITRKKSKPTLSQITYFLGIGAGFMFIELYLIKGLILLVGDPFISFTLVVSAILIFSSLGGLWVHTKSVRNIRPALLTLTGVLILTAICLELLSVYLLRIPPVLRYFTALLLMLPAGFLMGMPFPLGMRYLLNSPVQRAYAWSVNGCASVLSAIVAICLVGERMCIGAERHCCSPGGDQFWDSVDCSGGGRCLFVGIGGGKDKVEGRTKW